MEKTTLERPKTGPWIIPAREARSGYVHTQTGIFALSDLVPKNKLREDQKIQIAENRRRTCHKLSLRLGL